MSSSIRSAVLFAGIVISVACGDRYAIAAAPTKPLVFEGTVTSIRQTRDELTPWLVTMMVEKVVSGEFNGGMFSFAVHSPARAGWAEGQSYKVKAVWKGSGYVVAESQTIEADSEARGTSEPQAAARGSITVSRAENSGLMNLVPCWLTLDGQADVVSATIARLGEKPESAKWTSRGIRLIGGDTAVLAVRRGAVSVRVETSVSEQPPSYAASKARAWRSEPLRVVVSGDGPARLVVLPTSAGSTYRGGWRVRLLRPDEDANAAK